MARKKSTKKTAKPVKKKPTSRKPAVKGKPLRHTVYLGADHAGFSLKNKIKKYLLSKKYLVYDLGAGTLQPEDDYPDYAFKVAKKVSGTSHFGILVCGSAEGVCIAANKIKDVRAVAPFSQGTAKLSRQHNDANVLCLSGWSLSLDRAIKYVDVFLSTSFTHEPRHERRLKKIAKEENKKN